jgi:hypothetical protein
VLVERDASINRLVSLAFHASGEGWRGTLEQDESRFAQYFFAARRLAMQASAEANVPSPRFSESCRAILIYPPGAERSHRSAFRHDTCLLITLSASRM